jgi:hypothetical protein
MKEQITLRIYEAEGRAPVCDTGRYQPDPIDAGALDTGVTIGLTDEGGGRVFGIIDKVDPHAHEDDRGHRYRLVTAWVQD